MKLHFLRKYSLHRKRKRKLLEKEFPLQRIDSFMSKVKRVICYDDGKDRGRTLRRYTYRPDDGESSDSES